MADRITQKDLEQQVAALNWKINGFAGVTYKTINSYQLSYAYGGVQLHQVVSEGGGVRTISTGGYGTKRELYNFMAGMLAGV